MKRTKLLSVLSGLVAFIMMLSVVSFADLTEGAPVNETNDWLNKGWSRLYEGQVFEPDKSLTRAELVALINSLFNFKEQGEISFTDVPTESTYYKEVSKAFNAGYVKGRPNSIFDPEAEVNKAEAYIMIAKVLKLDTSKQADHMLQFKDANEVPNWAIGAVESLAEKGLINDKNKVKPFEKVLGSEAVELLEKIYFEDEGVTNEKPDAKQEEKGNGKSPLNLEGAFFVAIDNNKSIELGKVEDGIGNEDIIIKLVFDRGIIRENWENNKEQIKLQANNGDIIESEVFKIDGVEEEKSHIFIRPLEDLKSGKKINIVIGKDLKANNGNALGNEQVVTFSIQ